MNQKINKDEALREMINLKKQLCKWGNSAKGHIHRPMEYLS